MRKYTSNQANRRVAEPFELDGVQFKPGDGISFLDITELGRYANANMDSPEGASAVGEFFAQLLGEDYDRFRKHVREHRTDDDTLIRVLHDIVEDLSGHPSQRPSVSPTGPTNTGRMLRVVSLSGGTVVEEPLTEAREAELIRLAAMDDPESQAG